MALAHERADPRMPVVDIRDRLELEAPDRAEFAALSGIARVDIDTIDIYRGSAEIYCFPTGDELLGALPPALRLVEFAPSGSYELSEHCPLAILQRV
jgi:hypothetical protein